jgi:hypothetical protein
MFLGTNQIINLMPEPLKQDHTYISLRILFGMYLPISPPPPPTRSITSYTAKKNLSVNIKAFNRSQIYLDMLRGSVPQKEIKNKNKNKKPRKTKKRKSKTFSSLLLC